MILTGNPLNFKSMNIIIKWTGIELSEPLEQQVHEKIGSLEKFMEENGEQATARVELAKTTEHHRSGEIFRAEVNLSLPRKQLRVEAEDDNLYKAIDEVKEKLAMRLGEYKKEKVLGARRKRRVFDNLKRISPLAWARGEFKKMRGGNRE